MPTRHLHFITGRLAAPSLRSVVDDLSQSVGFAFTIQVMPITVAALLTPAWIAKRLQIPTEATELWLPGYCDTDLSPITQSVDIPVIVGPRELRALPERFGQLSNRSYGDYSIEIIAEINHAPRLGIERVLEIAQSYARDGADWIDVGCDPQSSWPEVGECVRALRDEGYRVSIDSLRTDEIARAVGAGAELVLSVNGSNRHAAADWGCPVVVIPDEPQDLESLADNVGYLADHQVPMRIDPILEPIGCGFAQSLGRYLEIRKRYPDAEMMMGVGNLTELTDVDSAGVNTLLLGFCEELGIRSVLTTQVISWARSSVRECDVGRRLAKFAVDNQCPPKRLDDRLVMLRDTKLYPVGEEAREVLAASLKDNNYRLFAEDGRLHLMAAGIDLTADNAFELFRELQSLSPSNLDASHAFYLGYELAKATTALTLGKQYNQDQALDWGMLTQPEDNHRQRNQAIRSSDGKLPDDSD